MRFFAVLAVSAFVVALTPSEAEAGCSYDIYGNFYCTQATYDGTTLTGWNKRGQTWRTTYKRNGNSSGYDKKGRYWNYNSRTGSYYRSDGRSCFGKGALRTCY